MLISLALAVGAVAVVSTSETELRSARADFERAEVASALAGGQEEAAVSIFSSAGGGALRWNEEAAGHKLEVLAEPEAMKTSVAAVISMEDRALTPLMLVDADQMRARLRVLSIAQAVGAPLEAADASPIWRVCARSLISPFGLTETLQPLPQASLLSDASSGHVGEIWRVWVRDSSGWTDDRVVRLTGDNLHPAATLEREFSKRDRVDSRCNSYFSNVR